MENILTENLSYKGYTSIIKYSNEDNTFYGKLENIKDLIIFEIDIKEVIELHFENIVNTYIQDRKELDEQSR